MKNFNQALCLRDVLPSALTVVALGLLFSALMTTRWSLLGDLGLWTIPLGALFGVALYVGCFALTCRPPFYTASMKSLMRTLHSLFRNFSWFDIVVISCLAGIGEELLIRGALQSWLVDDIGPVVGVVIASVAFGLLHFLSRMYILVTALLGALFGVALLLTDSILLVIIAHAVYDVCAFFTLVKRPDLLGIDSENEKFKVVF